MKISTENLKLTPKIMREFDTLPKTIPTQMMRGYAESHLTEALAGQEKWEDALYFYGLGRTHALVHSGQLASAKQVGSGWYIENQEGWNKLRFAEIAIPEFVSGFESAKNRIPQNIQKIIQKLYPLWFANKYGLKYSKEKIDFLLNPRPIAMPFDHFTENRNFIGGIFNYPRHYNRKPFNYMKADEYPPTIYYSNRPENDFETHVKQKADKQNITIEQAITETGRHEASHLLAINPAVALAMKGKDHCWLTEGVAQHYGESDVTKAFKMRELETPNDIVKITDKNVPVNYASSLLLTMAIAIKFSGSAESIELGMEKIIATVANKAQYVSKGKSTRVNSPTELLYLIDPTLRNTNEQRSLLKIMNSLHKSML